MENPSPSWSSCGFTHLVVYRLKGKPGYPPFEVVKKYGKLLKVECYVGQLNQVLMNLFANAIDALEDAHKSRARQENFKPSNQILIETELLPNSQSVLIKIKDSGLGIKPENQLRFFDPFFTTKPVDKGTDLGLYISYQNYCPKTSRVSSVYFQPRKRV